MAALIVLQNVRDYLVGIGEAIPATHDTALQLVVDGVSAEVETFCRRKFSQATYTEQYTGDPIRISPISRRIYMEGHLFFRQWPVTAITSVKIDGVLVTEGADPANFDLTTYRQVKNQEGDVIMLFRGLGWMSNPYGIELVYQAGYAGTPPAIPADLKKALAQLCAEEYLFRGKQGLSNESFGGMNLTLDRWPANVVKALRKYQAPRL
jgi:hypothetical protein